MIFLIWYKDGTVRIAEKCRGVRFEKSGFARFMIGRSRDNDQYVAIEQIDFIMPVEAVGKL